MPSEFAHREVFSAAQARRAGFTSDALARLVGTGGAHPLIRGWYATRPPQDQTDWNRLATRAAFMRMGRRAMASHTSALIWQRLPTVYAGLGRVHLTRIGPGSSRIRPPVKLHAAIPGLEASDRVPVAHAVIQSGLEYQPLTALAAADAALHTGRMSLGDLAAALPTFAGHTNVGPVRAILAEADARIESPGESILGHRVRSLGWDVQPQFRVETDLGRKFADFRIKGTRLLLEFDGAIKYRDDDGPDAVFREKRREDSFRRRRWLIERFVWSELDDTYLIDRRIRTALQDDAA